MARRGVADFMPKDLVTRDRQNAYWKEIMETSCNPHVFHALNSPLAALIDVTRGERIVSSRGRNQTPIQDTRKHSPFADIRSPTGAFYKPLLDDKVRIFEGAAGQSRTIVGYSSASAFHSYLNSKERG